jgi:TonB family protein
MISAPAESRGWSARHWGSAVAVVFALQVASIFWLEDRSPIAPRRPDAPVLRFSDNRMGELLALEDPTLFALPHRQGFSGEAWLNGPSLPFQPEDWSEPARLLSLDVQDLGACLTNFVETDIPAPFPTVALLKPELTVPASFSIAPPATPSRLRLEGELANRRLLSSPQLPRWTNADLLADSIVQLLVDAQGDPLSAVLLPPGSGLEDADRCALELARAARFEPLKPGGSTTRNRPSQGLSVGTMVFEWQTIPAPFTNTASTTP